MYSRSELRRKYIGRLFAVALFIASTAAAQRDVARDVVRVVVVQGPATAVSKELIDGFRKRLEQSGRHAEIATVETDGDSPLAPNAGGTAVLVLALGSRATAVASNARRNVPIIGALLTRESALPEGSAAAPVVLEFTPDVELEWLHRILPNVQRVGVLYSSDENATLVARAREVAKGLNIEIVARRVAGPSEIPAALAALSGSTDAIWGIPDDIVLTAETAKSIILASLRSRVPFIGLSSPWVRAGAVYALDRDYGDLGAQTADLAVRLLGGASARSIGTTRPRKIRYALNARSAEMIGLVLSADVVRGASEVIR